MAKVFISHSTFDRDIIETEIVRVLEAAGVETWYSKDGIRPADHWERTILKGLEECDWFVVVLTPDAAASEWVKDELNWAMDHRAGRIIPVLVAACDLTQFHLRLPRIQTIDFRTEREAARAKLVSRVTVQGRGRGEPAGQQGGIRASPVAQAPGPEGGNGVHAQITARWKGCALTVSIVMMLLSCVWIGYVLTRRPGQDSRGPDVEQRLPDASPERKVFDPDDLVGTWEKRDDFTSCLVVLARNGECVLSSSLGFTIAGRWATSTEGEASREERSDRAECELTIATKEPLPEGLRARLALALWGVHVPERPPSDKEEIYQGRVALPNRNVLIFVPGHRMGDAPAGEVKYIRRSIHED